MHRRASTHDGRMSAVVKGATRVLFIFAAILAVPFIVAAALAKAQGERR